MAEVQDQQTSKDAVEIFAAMSQPAPGGGTGDRMAARDAHLAYKARLETLGVMIASGPMIDTETGKPLSRGLWILRAPSLAAAAAVAGADPYVARGFRTVEVQRWRMTPPPPPADGPLPDAAFWTDPGRV